MFSGHSARPLCLPSDFSAIAFRLAPKPLCLFSNLSAVTLRLAHRELHERQGETVRKLDRKYCHIAVRLCFQTRVCAYYPFGESFSAGLLPAKTTEAGAKITETCDKWCPCHQAFSRLPSPLAHRELHEWRGETVRKRPQILPILQPGYFFAQGMCLYIFVGSFSVGLRLAKITEVRTTLCNARFLARCLCSDLSQLRSSLRSGLLAIAFRLAT